MLKRSIQKTVPFLNAQYSIIRACYMLYQRDDMWMKVLLKIWDKYENSLGRKETQFIYWKFNFDTK